MKKVAWLAEVDGGKYPFCPYCNEFAYEKDHCVFCGKKYKWREGRHKERAVTVGEYTVVQTTNNHISITKGDRMVYHAQYGENLNRKFEWVSTKEKLPPPYQKVLVYDGSITTDFVTYDSVWYNHNADSVSYWMIIPEPPKGE